MAMQVSSLDLPGELGSAGRGLLDQLSVLDPVFEYCTEFSDTGMLL